MSEFPNHEQLEQRLTHMPTPEDWVALQGGKPAIFLREPQQPNSKGLFFVMHVYGEPFENSSEDDTASFPDHYGMVVPTPFVQMERSILNPDTFEVDPKNEDGEHMGPKLVRFPSALIAARHGIPCLERSRMSSPNVNHNEGVFVENADQYHELLNNLGGPKLREYRLGVNAVGAFYLRPKETPKTLGKRAIA